MIKTNVQKSIQLTVAFATLSLASASYASNIRATVNGEYITFPDVQPIMINNRVMVPVRGVFEHLNADVNWNEGTQAVTAVRGATTVVCTINSNVATIDGREVSLDSPVRSMKGRTMVPLRFLSESLNASVVWVADTRTVEIKTESATDAFTTLQPGTVIPFSLLKRLTSDSAKPGDPFTAALELTDDTTYQGIPSTAVLYGEVEVARAKTEKAPGVLGLKFNKIKFSNGKSYAVDGTLIGLDEKSILNENGKLVAKPNNQKDTLKYVGYGAGAGTLIAILTKGNVVTDALIGGALGLIFGNNQKQANKPRDVVLATGTKFGVRLTREFAFLPSAISFTVEQK